MKINTADTWFSRYIRLRDAQLSNGELINQCATSGKWMLCKELECGHFVSRRHKGLRYNAMNAMPQSTYENKWKYGNPLKMAEAIDKKFGEGTSEKLQQMSREVSKVDEKLMAVYYKELTNNLLKERGWYDLRWWK